MSNTAHDETCDSRSLARLLRYLPGMGITRVGDLTGLDRVGIDVVQAVRPLGLANAVTQGKGRSREAAAISAIMEAAEQFFAERVGRFDTVVARARDMEGAHGMLAPHLLADAPSDWFDSETAWTEARDLLSGSTMRIPFEIVHTAYTEPGQPGDGLFRASTTGLACAFDEDSAMTHGVLECIERDAIARAQRTHGFFQRFAVDISQSYDDTLCELVAKLETAGLICAMWHAPSPTNIPVIWCQIMESGNLPLLTPYPADGFAADLDPYMAARRALLEAAQSRLAAISGARDDISRAAYPKHTDWQIVEAHRRLLRDERKTVELSQLPLMQETDGAKRLAFLLRAISQADLGPALCVRIDTEPFADIKAVRVFIPSLLPLDE